jgi:hypothetical protein
MTATLEELDGSAAKGGTMQLTLQRPPYLRQLEGSHHLNRYMIGILLQL